MRYYFGERGWPTSKLGPAPAEQDAREAMLNTLQDRKTDIYKEMIRGGTATVIAFWKGIEVAQATIPSNQSILHTSHLTNQVRPGVLRLIEEARTLGDGARPKLAICSASTKTSCLFVLDNLLGPSVLQHFDLILAGDDVEKRKPDPEIYRLASQRYVCWCVGLTDVDVWVKSSTDATQSAKPKTTGSACPPAGPSWWRTASSGSRPRSGPRCPASSRTPRQPRARTSAGPRPSTPSWATRPTCR